MYADVIQDNNSNTQKVI